MKRTKATGDPQVTQEWKDACKLCILPPVCKYVCTFMTYCIPSYVIWQALIWRIGLKMLLVSE